MLIKTIILQVDILHPLADVICRTLAEIDDVDDYIRATTLGNKIYMVREVGDKTSLSMLSNQIVTSLPSSKCGITTYQSKLVLVGGEVEKTLSKLLWTGDIDIDWTWTGKEGLEWYDPIDLHWQASLPPMSIARCRPSVVNTGSPECLAVAGGTGKDLCMVEVLIENQWWYVGEAPGPVNNIIFHKDRLYLSGASEGLVYHCDFKMLRDFCLRSHQDHSSKLPKPAWSAFNSYGNLNHLLVSHGEHLLAVAIDDNIISAYSSKSNSMVPVGIFELVHDVHAFDAVVTPTGKLIVFASIPTRYINGIVFFEFTATGMHNSYINFIRSYFSSTIFIARSMYIPAVPPYDPNGTFDISSLHKLEDAGIKVVTSCLDNFSSLQSAVGIVLSKKNKVNWRGEQRSELECLEVVVRRWGLRKGHHPPNWRSLLQVVSEMGLKGLSQQLENYLTGEYSCRVP